MKKIEKNLAKKNPFREIKTIQLPISISNRKPVIRGAFTVMGL